MKKLFKTVLCVILAFSVSCMGVACFAEEAGGPVYVSLGDSIADGIGLPANPLRGPDQPDKTLVYCNKTEGAYPTVAAELMGIKTENYYQLGCAGMRSVELRYCLDPSYEMPNHDANNFMGNELQEWVLSRFNYVELVGKADIITMNMCANDIATCALFAVREAMAAEGLDEAALGNIMGDSFENGEYFEALAKLVDYAYDFEYYGSIVTAAVEGLSEGYTIWAENWDAICGKIYELNPDVTLVCLGMYNPFNTMKLSDTSVFEIGVALDGIVSAINTWSMAGSSYADRYTYVSIMGIESMFAEQGKTFTDEDLFDNLELNVHPSLKGQHEIAERVAKAVEGTGILTDPLQLIEDLGAKDVRKSVASASRAATKVISRIASLFK